jgi:Rrf2 family transcriptional regulator, nitric oxide-sensitive transcriptional repressor
MEQHPAVVDCSTCILRPGCGLVAILTEAREAFYDSLSTHTIASVIENDARSARLLRESGEAMRTT